MQRLFCGLAMVVLLGVGATSTARGQSAPPIAASLLTSASALAARLDDPALVVIDAQRDTIVPGGAQIPGARFLSLRAITVVRDGVPSELPPVAALDSVLESLGISSDSRIVIYGDPVAAARLFFTLDYVGMGAQASLLDGGLPAWRAANLPLAERAAAPKRGRLELHPNAGLLIETAELGTRLGASNLVLLDARPTPEFTGEVAGEAIARPGHIPGAYGFFWRTALTSGEPAMLKDAAELRRLLALSGVAEGKELVTYCRTGVQASYLYFVLRYLGYAPRLYDGSYAEWSQGTARMVER